MVIGLLDFAKQAIENHPYLFNVILPAIKVLFGLAPDASLVEILSWSPE